MIIRFKYVGEAVVRRQSENPGRAKSRSHSQPKIPGGREKVTQINMCTANKQMHDKHKDQFPLPQC